MVVTRRATEEARKASLEANAGNVKASLPLPLLAPADIRKRQKSRSTASQPAKKNEKKKKDVESGPPHSEETAPEEVESADGKSLQDGSASSPKQPASQSTPRKAKPRKPRARRKLFYPRKRAKRVPRPLVAIPEHGIMDTTVSPITSSKDDALPPSSPSTLTSDEPKAEKLSNVRKRQPKQTKKSLPNTSNKTNKRALKKKPDDEILLENIPEKALVNEEISSSMFLESPLGPASEHTPEEGERLKLSDTPTQGQGNDSSQVKEKPVKLKKGGKVTKIRIKSVKSEQSNDMPKSKANGMGKQACKRAKKATTFFRKPVDSFDEHYQELVQKFWDTDLLDILPEMRDAKAEDPKCSKSMSAIQGKLPQSRALKVCSINSAKRYPRILS